MALWFRMHADAVNNPKLKLLAFEDRWHFVAVCCMKAEGLLDEKREHGLRERLIAMQLGLSAPEADEVRKRLLAVELIGEDWQPRGWKKYQYLSDNSTDRVRKHRKKQQDKPVKRSGNVSETPPETDTETETETERQPRRRVPKDWKLSEKGREFAAKKGMSPSQIETELELFRDYEWQKPKTDFDACWRTRCTNWKKFGGASDAVSRDKPL